MTTVSMRPGAVAVHAGSPAAVDACVQSTLSSSVALSLLQGCAAVRRTQASMMRGRRPRAAIPVPGRKSSDVRTKLLDSCVKYSHILYLFGFANRIRAKIGVGVLQALQNVSKCCRRKILKSLVNYKYRNAATLATVAASRTCACEYMGERAHTYARGRLPLQVLQCCRNLNHIIISIGYVCNAFAKSATVATVCNAARLPVCLSGDRLELNNAVYSTAWSLPAGDVAEMGSLA